MVLIHAKPKYLVLLFNASLIHLKYDILFTIMFA